MCERTRTGKHNPPGGRGAALGNGLVSNVDHVRGARRVDVGEPRGCWWGALGDVLERHAARTK